MNLQKSLVKIVAISLRAFSRFFGYISKKSGFVGKGLYHFGRAIFFVLVFPGYKVIHWLRYRVLSVYSPAKSKAFHVLNKSYLIHVFVIIIGLTVAVNNIRAEELRDEKFGEKTIIYSIVSKDTLEELTEEKMVYSSGENILSYLDKTASVESQQKIIESDDNIGDQLVAEISTITDGGAAIVKPNILEGIKPSEVPTLETVVATSGKEITNYVVKSGETISAISNKFNVSVETILWQNNLGPRSLIRPGDSLEILPVTGVAHKVKRGENIGAIAKKYDIEVNEIVTYNNLFDVNDIQINQKLIIPGGKKVSPYVSTPSYASNSNVPQVSSITKLFAPSTSAPSASGMVWPAGVRRISQYYSWRHRGLDIAGPTGTPLYASEAGTVIYSGWSNGYGYNVYVDHGNGVKTRYAHASKLHVSKGAKVSRGQHIANMGSTGWSTGPHIHFEVIVGGVKKNPLSYVK